MAEIKTEKQKKTELLKHVLSNEEKQNMGDELARGIQKIKELEDSLASVSSNLKASIKEQEATVNKLAGIIRSGYEYRDTPVEIEKDYKLGRIIKTRMDTKEIYEDRSMTEGEKQGKLI